MKFSISILLTVAVTLGQLYSQTSDDNYTVPLSEVLDEVRTRYDVAIRDPDHLVHDQKLTFALWRFRPGVEKTLFNVLTPFDLEAQKEGEGKYKLKSYRYHLLSVEEGREKLDHLSSLYNDAASWEIRKKELRSCIIEALELDILPPAPGSRPVISNKRKKNGYTVENVGLETLPGLYVATSVYRPVKIRGKLPVILCPNGHFPNGRYHPQIQERCAALARMGAIVVNYDLFGYGESRLQVKPEDHRSSLAMTIQAMNSTRILDYLLGLPEADPTRVGITGASGGGSQTMLISAIDDRICVGVPVVMMSVIHSGGCPCESGKPIHLCGNGTTNVEIAGMFAPGPQMVITDGGDWTANVPELEFPFLARIYSFYNAGSKVKNVHLADEGHDYGPSKRFAMYEFMATNLGLDISRIQDKNKEIDESFFIAEDEKDMYVFGEKGELLPEGAIKSKQELEQLIESYRTKK